MHDVPPASEMSMSEDRQAVYLEAAPFLLVDDVVRSGEYWRDVLGFNLGRYFGDPPGFTIMSKMHEALDLYIWVSDVVALVPSSPAAAPTSSTRPSWKTAAARCWCATSTAI
jgi:hypothetical protein